MANEQPIKTASDLIDIFGGTTETARLYGVLPSAVSNWRRTGFPPRLHYRISEDAKGLGVELDPVIFKQTPEAAGADTPSPDVAA